MKDKISALLDGDLDERACGAVLDSMRHEAGLKSQWDDYCLIGDVLRGENNGSIDFTARVMAGLEAEPTVLAPVRQTERREKPFIRALLPIAASVMGVAAVGLVAASLYRQEAPAPQLAAGSAQVQLVNAAGVRPAAAPAADPMREYLLAHQGLSRGGPMPAGVQYIRTVADTSEGADR